MANVMPNQNAAQLDQMHSLYRRGGADREMAPHVVYRDGGCPHAACEQKLQAIGFRLEAFGRVVHDPLVQAWWADEGFVGRCPSCGGWIHFTILGKRAVDDSEVKSLPHLPDNWADEAVIL
jgi:hypothetical protein